MKLLVSGCTATMRRMLPERPDRLGILFTPADDHRLWWPEETTWACDNGCFGGLDSVAWLRMLAKVKRSERLPSWIACPDSVADMPETWRLFHQWHRAMLELDLPIALVIQDGIEKLKWRAALPWAYEQIDAIFVGGSTAFKLSETAMQISLEAHRKGKLVHFGRVNSLRRILYIGREMASGRAWCDTIDGGSSSRWGNIIIPKLIRYMDWAARCRSQELLF